jgi:hypothetical protein
MFCNFGWFFFDWKLFEKFISLLNFHFSVHVLSEVMVAKVKLLSVLSYGFAFLCLNEVGLAFIVTHITHELFYFVEVLLIYGIRIWDVE